MWAYGYPTQVRIASGMNTLLGLWLIFSPLAYDDMVGNMGGAWNSIVVGVLIVVFGGARLHAPLENAWLSWVNAILGAWIAWSPRVYDYMDGAPLWNSLFVGLTVVLLALCSGTATAAERRARMRGMAR
jgi:hypothetical protein